eukprot:406028-Pelagomonas_calceolata.AAC.1
MARTISQCTRTSSQYMTRYNCARCEFNISEWRKEQANMEDVAKDLAVVGRKPTRTVRASWLKVWEKQPQTDLGTM